jgi:signal transduction histidine kinase
VVQEAVTNIAKHAEAETVLIQGAAHEDAVTIEIEDDGKGFDAEAIAVTSDTGTGLGLIGMRERVELLGGTVAVESAPGQGTRIVLSVPLVRPA